MAGFERLRQGMLAGSDRIRLIRSMSGLGAAGVMTAVGAGRRGMAESGLKTLPRHRPSEGCPTASAIFARISRPQLAAQRSRKSPVPIRQFKTQEYTLSFSGL